MAARRGFTLIEAMFAASIFLLVAGGAVGVFLGIQRMTRTALAETELATDMRILREKLLFRLERPSGGRLPDGLLSGEAFSTPSFASSGWLNSGVTVDWTSADVLDESKLSEDNVRYVNLEMSANGVTRRERIAVPVFGAVQTTVKGGVFP